MTDRFGRIIDQLRISVTDRCNLRCRYCMPASGVKLLRNTDILSFEEILDVARAAVGMGITKIRLTGGEPLVRRGVVHLVEKLASIDGLVDLAMTTNGTLLAEHARSVADAGLQRVNISLDTTDPHLYRQMTRCGDIRAVLAGIRAAQAARLHPIKLNCVVGGLLAGSDALSVKEFGRTNGLQVRIIRMMHFERGVFSVVEGGRGGDCRRCNRLRLSSDGSIRPCLFSDVFLSVRRLGPSKSIRLAVAKKPQAGGPCAHQWMYRIGG
ncbi:MAG: radical SAM protein [Phycisphaerales bacterium]|nr:MAG: radical SAM protein [Phycisphaerales bacterium]